MSFSSPEQQPGRTERPPKRQCSRTGCAGTNCRLCSVYSIARPEPSTKSSIWASICYLLKLTSPSKQRTAGGFIGPFSCSSSRRPETEESVW